MRNSSIHQPSSELFQSFDRLLLLRKGGQTCYFGDLGENSATLICKCGVQYQTNQLIDDALFCSVL
jgi:hypothetical protein